MSRGVGGLLIRIGIIENTLMLTSAPNARTSSQNWDAWNLSVTAIALFVRYAEVAKLRISPFATAAVLIAIGLVVTRLIESYGRPASARTGEMDPEGWDDGAQAVNNRAFDPGPGWSSPRQGGWTSQLPARSTDDTWGGAADERWGVK